LRLEAEDRGRRAEGRDQRTEVKKSEDRGRKAEGSRRWRLEERFA